MTTNAPRRARGAGHDAWRAAAVCVVGTMVLAYPALAGRFLVNPHSDQYLAGYAFRAFAAHSLRTGHGFPQWNPYLFGGLPYVAAMHGDIFYPTFLLRLVLPVDVAMTWSFILHVMLAGFFTYGFLRAWGLDLAPALTGGVAYMMSGIVSSYVSPGHDGQLYVSALTPLGLWLLLRGIRDGRAWAWGTFALVVGLAVVSPHPQMLQYFLLVGGAFSLFVAFGADSDGRHLPRAVALRRLGIALGAVALGGLVGAVQFLPVREYIAWSPRAGGVSYAFAGDYSMPPAELLNVYLPQFSGILDHFWWRGGLHLDSNYLGVVVLFLAPLALGRGRNRRFARFWLGVAVVSALWALGSSTPFYHLVYLVVPGTRYFRFPSIVFCVTALAASILAAVGVDRLLDGRVRMRYVIGWLVAGGGVVLLATTGALTSFATTMVRHTAEVLLRAHAVPPGQTPHTIAWYLVRPRENAPLLLAGAWRSFGFVVLCGVLAFASWRRRTNRRLLGALIVLAVAADLWSIDRHYWMFMPPADRVYAGDPVTSYLERQSQPGRVVVMATSDTAIEPGDPYFGLYGRGKGTGFMIHGIRSVTGYHGNELARYRVVGGAADSPFYENVLQPVFWRHENARWLYTNRPVRDTAMHLVLGPVTNAAGSTAYLYRLPGEHPYAWVAAAARRAPDDSAVAQVLDPRFDPSRVALVEDEATPQGVAAATPDADHAAPPRAMVERWGAGWADIALDAPAAAGAVLVVAENYYPGWTATVDGRPAHTARVDYNLIGVTLPANARRIALRFSDPAVAAGARVTCVALLLIGACIVAGLIVDRRRRGGLAAGAPPPGGEAAPAASDQ